MSGVARNSWIVTRATGAERVRLFCFPFAGGSGLTYRPWHDGLPQQIGVHAVQLPGRGPRLAEAPIDDMEALLDAFMPSLLPLLDRPFALFGHSMGAAIAYETARRLASRHRLHPVRVFVSARAAPVRSSRRAETFALNDEAFRARLRLLGGTPEEVLREPELMAMFLPMLRADFRLNDLYAPAPGPNLVCPMTVFGGRDDPVVHIDELDAWRNLAGGEYERIMFEGGHHYFRDAQADLLAAIALRLIGPVTS